MSKYDELASLLIANQEDHLGLKFQCTDFVRKLRTGLVANWGIPDQHCSLFAVDGYLEPLINERLINKGFVLEDGYWYFCLSIKYQLGGKNLFVFSDNVMGVNKEGSHFVIKFYDKVFKIADDSAADHEACYNGMYQAFKQAYLDDRDGKKATFGFHIRKEQ